MFMTFPKRLALSATGLLLTTGLIVQPQSGEWRARLRDWVSPASAEVGRVAESPVVAARRRRGPRRRVPRRRGGRRDRGRRPDRAADREGEVGSPRRGPDRRVELGRPAGLTCRGRRGGSPRPRRTFASTSGRSAATRR